MSAKILVIDDEPDLRFFLREYLEDLGYEVWEAENGRDGLKCFREVSPDLIICDLRMPEIDGIEVLKTVTGENPQMPIVMISGAGVIQDVIEALRLGAWDYIVKPVSDTSLIKHVVTRALERSRLLKLQNEYQQNLESQVQNRTEELQKSREFLHEQLMFLETLFRSIPMGLYYTGLDGEILRVNEELTRILGLSLDELVGRNVKTTDFLKPLSFDIQDTLKSPKEASKKNARIFRWIRMDKKIDLAIHTAIVFETDDKPIGMVGLVRDITNALVLARQEREREQQLIQADKMISLGTLTAGVAHEINNPNHSILLFAPVLAQAWEEALPILKKHAEDHGDFVLAGLPFSRMCEKFRYMIQNVEENSRRIKGIVHDMKDFARLDADKNPNMVDVNDALKSSIRLVAHKLKKSCHNISLKYGENLPKVRINKRQLEQVLINLLINAAESLPDPSRGITVGTHLSETGEFITLRISDEGEGIPPDVLNRIFDPFFTTKREKGGTGLGLAISQRIVKRYGGDICYDSKPGKGSTATVLLPLPEKETEKS